MDPAGPSKSQENMMLPRFGIHEMLGLLEVLKSKGGKEDIYKLSNELNMDLGDTLTVIRGAELLGFVNTPGGDVEIVPRGLELSEAKRKERKEIVREQLHKIPVFQEIAKFVREQEDHEVTKDEVLEKLAELVPDADVEDTFFTVVNWGRFVEVFGYNDDEGSFYLDFQQDEDDDD